MFRAVILAACLAVVSGCSLEPMPRPTVLGPSGALVPVPLSGVWVSHSLVIWEGAQMNESVMWPYESAGDCEKGRKQAIAGIEKMGGKVGYYVCKRLGKGI